MPFLQVHDSSSSPAAQPTSHSGLKMYEPVQIDSTTNLAFFSFKYLVSFLTVVNLVVLEGNTGGFGLPLSEGQPPLRQDRDRISACPSFKSDRVNIYKNKYFF